jgi:hypothetical protein
LFFANNSKDDLENNLEDNLEVKTKDKIINEAIV